MKLLVLGGTVFLGRHLISAALARGHEVTIFSRGSSTPKGAIKNVEHLLGDRDGNLEALRGRSWDAVVDTSGYVPRVVSQSIAALRDTAGHYTFISSISVYKDLSMPGVDETSKLLELENPASEEIPKYYGELKVLCERVVQATYRERALIIRPGLIVGPYDPTDRFTYWPVRVANGGRVLAPGNPERIIQIIHGADLAEWVIRMIERREIGVFNATGPKETLTMGELLRACSRVSRSDAEFVWVPNHFLKGEGVGEWLEMPLWLSDEKMQGMLQANIDKAVQHGLTFRPVHQTIRETLNWNAVRPANTEWKAGLASTREAEILEAWNARESNPL